MSDDGSRWSEYVGEEPTEFDGFCLKPKVVRGQGVLFCIGRADHEGEHEYNEPRSGEQEGESK